MEHNYLLEIAHYLDLNNFLKIFILYLLLTKAS